MATGNTADLDFSDLTGEDHTDGTATGEGSAQNEDICRVCRVGSLPGRPLFHPCVCTGSIRYIHQDCLVQWLKHSGKEFCELCMHRFEFVPIYRPDMPKRLPVSELMGGLIRGALKNIRHLLHLGFVAFVWLVIVPICIYRIYSFLLYGSLWSIASFPLQLFSLDNLLLDDVYGLLIVFVSLMGFISMVWLKDQLGNGGAPNWLARDQQEVNQLRMREARNQIDNLANRLEEAGQRARERENAPERQAVATEIQQLHESLAAQMEQLTALEQDRHGRAVEELESRKRQLLMRLGEVPSLLATPTTERRDELVMPTVQDGTEGLRYRQQHPSPDPPIDLRRYGAGGPTRADDLWTHSRERERVLVELNTINEELERKRRSYTQYKDIVQQFLALTDRTPGDDTDNVVFPLLDAEEVGQEEKMTIIRIWELKEDIKKATQREQDVIEAQVTGDRERAARRDRWYNRIFRRGHQRPLDPQRRDAAQRPARPNIVPALVGLAREQPVDGANGPAQDNVEELTWARLLGLDGSFRFLEHVLWLICLNSALIIAFVYLPYQLGYFAAYMFKLWDWFGIKTWRGVASTLFGYIIATAVITAIYYFTGMLRLPRMKSILGMAYVGIKVGMILAVEAGIFPLMCGWWIDICSFALFGSTMKSRQASLTSAPGTVMFIHWLAGMIFIFYLASFVMLMREVVRPGVLWFLRNLNDQNFHPIHEMIGLPLQRHLKRFVMSCIMFGVCLVMILLLPSRLLLIVAPGFLPYRMTLASTFSPIREVQLELVLLQFVIPTLLEHGNCRTGLKVLMTGWATLSARLLFHDDYTYLHTPLYSGLHSYLLDRPQSGGDVVDLHGNVIPDVPVNPDPQGPVYTGPTQVLGPGFAPFKPYLRPRLFYLRMTGFLCFTLALTVAFACVLLVLPVLIGRLIMSLFGVTQAPEIYTAAVGLYTLWLVLRFGTTFLSYLMQGTEILIEQVKLWSLQGVKCLVAGFLLFVVIPLLLGHLVDLLLISPLRVPHDRTPVYYPSTEWALGLLHTKCTCGAIWLTNINFKAKLDRVYQDGLKNLDLMFVVKDIAWPVIVPLSLFITVPYVVTMGVLPALDVVTDTTSLLLYRYFFPSVLVLMLFIAFIVFIVKQLRRLYTHIKNEKYLVGRQLVNYSTREELVSPVLEEGESAIEENPQAEGPSIIEREREEYEVPVQETH